MKVQHANDTSFYSELFNFVVEFSKNMFGQLFVEEFFGEVVYKFVESTIIYHFEREYDEIEEDKFIFDRTHDAGAKMYIYLIEFQYKFNCDAFKDDVHYEKFNYEIAKHSWLANELISFDKDKYTVGIQKNMIFYKMIHYGYNLDEAIDSLNRDIEICLSKIKHHGDILKRYAIEGIADYVDECISYILGMQYWQYLSERYDGKLYHKIQNNM